MTPGRQKLMLRACDLAFKQLTLDWETRGRPNLKDFKIHFEVRTEDDIVLLSSPQATFQKEEREVVGSPRYERPDVL